jgi:hypothetical protein
MGEKPETWCTCNNMGICLSCAIERLVREHLGTQGLAYLLAHIKKVGEYDK